MSRCVRCRKTVNPKDIDTWSEVTVWVGGPKKDSSRMRHYTHRYMHGDCMKEMNEGATINQARLDDYEMPPRVLPDSEVAPSDLPFGEDE